MNTEAFVAQRMAALLSHPESWGPFLAVELQLLLLIEIRHSLNGEPEEHVYATIRRFCGFIGKRFPGPPTSLAERLQPEQGEEAKATFMQALREFVAAEFPPT